MRVCVCSTASPTEIRKSVRGIRSGESEREREREVGIFMYVSICMRARRRKERRVHANIWDELGAAASAT